MADPIRPSVQAAEPSYELHTLGWKAFQQLCLSITAEIWGQTVQGFFDSRDGGRDGAFHGVWMPQRGEAFAGAFTAQCKFSARPAKSLKLADLQDELGKAQRLAERGLATNYILFTNHRLTGRSDEELRAAFEAIPGIGRFAAYGLDRISQFIRESPRLRMLVPRVYGLGDLSQILDQRAYDQAQEILSSLGDDLAKFVITEAYRKSAKAIVEHGFVLLLGEPACGKSAIAAALALGALDEWGCSTVKVRDADDFVAHWNAHEPKQFFWVDDAFGGTQLDWQATVKWNKAFPHVRAALRRGARFVFTSRDYIYRNARNFLKESGLPVLNESQVVIRVEQLTKEEREQILYNHVRLGTQPASFKRKVKMLLPAVAAHFRFSPELARRLGHPAFTKNLGITASSLERFVEHPVELLQEIIRTLDVGSRAAIALVFMRGGALSSPITLSAEEDQAIALLGATAAEVRNALNALDGSLLLQVQQAGSVFWRFKHPTILDAFAETVAANRELMDIYLLGTPVRRLLAEISCGTVRLAGVKVRVPADRYDALIGRIDSFFRASRENRDAVNRFVASRCDRNFLGRFVARLPDFTAGLGVMSYFYAVSDIGAINRLHQFGLLPESERRDHVASIQKLALNTPDGGFLKKETVSFLTEEEVKETLAMVRSGLLNDLESCIEAWRDGYDGSDDPDDHFDHLKIALRQYEEAFGEDEEVIGWISEARAKIEKVIEDLRANPPESPDSDDYTANQAIPRGGSDSEARSIFDDVDE